MHILMEVSISMQQKSRLLITYSMPLVGFALVPRVEAGPKKVHPREVL